MEFVVDFPPGLKADTAALGSIIEALIAPEEKIGLTLELSEARSPVRAFVTYSGDTTSEEVIREALISGARDTVKSEFEKHVEEEAVKVDYRGDELILRVKDLEARVFELEKKK